VKKLFAALVLFNCQLLTANCQLNYWQQEVNYTIEVSLNDKDHTLNGFEKIEYINNSPDTLKFIWFHIWPNAYKNDKTAFSDQLLENGNTKFYFSDKEQKGYINRLDFKVNNVTAATQDHPEHIDIIKIILPSPLPPHQKILITTPFHEKLPYNFSRGGHDRQSYQVTQWYPKPAVYDNKGWHPMTYLDQGEFYSEFGSFDVSITVPENYVIAATGELQNEKEREWLKTRSSFKWDPVKRKIKTKSGGLKTVYDPFPPSSSEIKILRFKQNNVHDFAWFADKRFIINHDTCGLTSGRVIDVYTYYTPAQKDVWRNSVRYAKDAIHHYSNLVGEYPYNIVSAVQGPESFGGGMEYPTITVLSPDKNPIDLDFTLAHEIGHNWFYGILASNERTHPWMDEGINSYYETLYSLRKSDHFNQLTEEEELQTLIAEKKDQPIENSSETFSEKNYDAVVYYKTSGWMAWLEKYLGTATFNKAMQEYFRQWKFKHPQPEDFKKILEEASGKNLDSAFSLLKQKGSLPGKEPKGVTIWKPLAGIFFGKELDKKSVITIFPALGYNHYDKLMIGGLITNVRTPPNRFQFLLAPMYATGSKKFSGIGFINESFYPNGIFRKINLGISGSVFSMDKYVDDNGNKTFLRFQKVVPSLRLTLKEKNPRSTFNRYIQFKTFLIGEDALRFYPDTIRNPPAPDTVIYKYNTLKENTTLNQLLVVIENYRALYPYRGELKIEQGKDFMRAAFTGNYFFNYSKSGGLDLRLFAGKFFYLGSKTFTKQFNTDRYHLNMTGPNGYEDYAYSDYFIGRNEFERTASQQIMVRDGAFKVRTDLLSDKVGKTDDWLIALNLSSGLPAGIDPLSLLPKEFPFQLKVFADIGTYAEPWKRNSTADRFLFDAGIRLSILKTINIYVPIIYSKVFKEYIQSTLPKKHRLFKIISFSIDISNFSSRKFDSKYDF
jgi:hypothetical protein